MYLFKIKVLFYYYFIKNWMYWIFIKKEIISYINLVLVLMLIGIGNFNVNIFVVNIDIIRIKKYFFWKKLMIFDK